MGPSRFATVAGLAFVVACTAESAEDVERSGQAATVSYDAAGRYDARVNLMRRLKTDHPLPEGLQDPRDGIVLQTEWQASTRDGSAGPDVLYAQTSGGRRVLYGWWPNVNYTLTAWQMQALQLRRGEYDDARVTGYGDVADGCVDASRFDATSAEARPVIDTIISFYDLVDSTARRARNGELGDDAARSSAEAELQARMWTFHEKALTFALARNEDYLGTVPRRAGCDRFGNVLPPGERSFARGWGRGLVPLLAAVNFSTGESLVRPINAYVLPQSVVRDADLDLVGGRSSMPPSQRAGAALIVKIDEVESTNDGPIRELLENAGANESFRAASTRFQRELIQLLDGMARVISGVRSGSGKAEGEGCLLDVQCADGLYCRNDWAFDFVCLPPGNLGEHCWTSEQCQDGLSCHWIAAHHQKQGPWYARVPHPARVCNPHGSGAHEHQPR